MKDNHSKNTQEPGLDHSPKDKGELLGHAPDPTEKAAVAKGEIVESTVAPVVEDTPTKKNRLKELLMDNIIYMVLLVLFIAIIAADPSFLSVQNFSNILQQSSTRIIMALGIGTILVTKGTDLSLGRQIGLAAVVSASLLQDPSYANRMYPNLPVLPVIVPILLVMIITMVISSLNGFVVAKLKVDPFIATLGAMIIVYGINSIYFESQPMGATPIGSLDTRFTNLATGSLNLGIIRVPYLILFALACILVMWVLWNKTTFGKNIFAVGGNIEAAKVSGINTTFIIIAAFAVAGLLYGLGGALEAARVSSATSNTGNMYELDAIAACIVGGLSFDGGIGSISGIIIGVLIFQVIAYGLNFISITPYVQNIIKGLIIIGAVALDSRKNAVRK
ncbi:Galactose/methyl galactoside ABC transport system, permease protein MglC [Clostridiaceae bacterium JG1575]|nr:Galactose/methyl galactoside ABC transport system, permease protein MglC [Clostridiaceae bacterium JG1575]